MPFITQERRAAIAAGTLEKLQPGDRCYVAYSMMVKRWKANPCWTTAHKLHRTVLSCIKDDQYTEDTVAISLAWQVFFQLHVMPYEMQKMEENGDMY